jgi:hypothetical protein
MPEKRVLADLSGKGRRTTMMNGIQVRLVVGPKKKAER